MKKYQKLGKKIEKISKCLKYYLWRFVCCCLATLMSSSRSVDCCHDSSGSWPSYFMASVERVVLLLSLLRVLDAALCFCRW